MIGRIDLRSGAEAVGAHAVHHKGTIADGHRLRALLLRLFALGGVQRLENDAHLMRVGHLLPVALILFVVDHVLLGPILKLNGLLVAAKARRRHDAHDLLVVVEDGEARQFALVREEGAVIVLLVLPLLVGAAKPLHLDFLRFLRTHLSLLTFGLVATFLNVKFRHAKLINTSARIEENGGLELTSDPLGHVGAVLEIVGVLLAVVLVLHVLVKTEVLGGYVFARLMRIVRNEVLELLGLCERLAVSISVEDALSSLH